MRPSLLLEVSMAFETQTSRVRIIGDPEAESDRINAVAAELATQLVEHPEAVITAALILAEDFDALCNDRTISEASNNSFSAPGLVWMVRTQLSEDSTAAMRTILDSQNETIIRMDETIADAEEVFAAQANLITTYENRVASQEDSITTLNTTIAAYDSIIVAQAATIATLRATIATKDDTVAAQANAIANLHATITAKDDTIGSQSDIMNNQEK